LIIRYMPENGEQEDFDVRSLRTSEASIVQRTIGLKWSEIEKGFETDDPEVLRGVAWVLRKRSQPSLRFGEFDPLIGELATRLDKREVVEQLENIFAVVEEEGDVSREAVAQVCQRIVAVAADPEHAEQLIAEKSRDPKDEPSEEAPQDAEGPSPSALSTTETSTLSEPSGSPSSPSS
jgi:hypothetical protein